MSSTLPGAATHSELHQGLELLGPIVRLQVQRAPLKLGEKPHRWYEPAPITAVSALLLDAGGTTGVDGDLTIPDVHHRDHELSRFRGENGISVGFTSHYSLMRDRFGDHLVDGIAGESILIATDTTFDSASVSTGIVIVTAEGEVPLTEVQIAAPCVEFSRFCLRYDRDQRTDRAVSEAVAFLHQGVRGFYATCGSDGQLVIRLGDLAFRRLPA
ncbi:MAG: hypothetical protein WBA63_06390 [Thermomicrobiales bacterium]